MTKLADGEWHRLHPATPLLRGGIAFIAILGVIIANLRERLIEMFMPGFDCPEDVCGEGGPTDPISFVLERYLVLGLLATAGVLLLIIGAFWLTWRMHTFRVTDEVVEVRSGIIFRSHRKARLDRIQGINITRPFIARLFGAAKLEISGAGADANVELTYLTSANADGLRAELLSRASGIREQAAMARAVADGTLPVDAAVPGVLAGEPGVAAPHGGLGELARQRIAELTAPELDPTLAPPQSVVTMHPGRLIGSTALSAPMIFLVLATVGAVSLMLFTPAGVTVMFGLIPAVFGIGSWLVNRVVKSLRYSIAATPDGVRVGYGLLSTANETLPPGRIHAVLVTQDLLWRPFGWWTVRINIASQSTSTGGGSQQNTTVLPVGSREDVLRVLELLLPDVVAGARLPIASAMGLATPEDGYTTTPRRGAILRWFSWRRNGFLVRPEAVLIRLGAIWRTLTIVPAPRIQSVDVRQGPLTRALRLASANVHTVAGPVSASIGALDVRDTERLMLEAETAAVGAMRVDRSHRWGAA